MSWVYHARRWTRRGQGASVDGAAQDAPHARRRPRSPRPSHRPGSAATTSAGGRWIGVSPPLLLTHTTTPSAREHPIHLGGEQEAVHEHDGVGRRRRRAGSRAPSASTRWPTSAGARRSISRDTSVASTRRHRLGQRRACRRRCRCRARRTRRRAAVAARRGRARRPPPRRAPGDVRVCHSGASVVEEGGHLGAGRRRPTAPGCRPGGAPGHDPHRVVGRPEARRLVARDVDGRERRSACPAISAAPARRSAASTKLRKSMAIVVGPDAADPGRDPAGDLLAGLVDVGQQRAALVPDAGAHHDAARA